MLNPFTSILNYFKHFRLYHGANQPRSLPRHFVLLCGQRSKMEHDVSRLSSVSLQLGECAAANPSAVSDGTLQNAYTKTKSGWSFVKNTNYFDRKETPPRV